jgi:uncharacterized protein YndB with AHSA1/START domain
MTNPSADDTTLVLDRIIRAPRARVWRCWTEPDLLRQWYCPKPWGVSHAELDVRPGGRNFVIMQGPEGQQVPLPGVYLEVVPGRRLVMTDAFERAWVPSGKAFMVADITLEDTPAGDTHCVSRALHWSVADREAHEKMGFHAGWGAAADQLEALARSL